MDSPGRDKWWPGFCFRMSRVSRPRWANEQTEGRLQRTSVVAFWRGARSGHSGGGWVI